jgi:hypothetical protein
MLFSGYTNNKLGYIKMVRIINANPGMGAALAEEESKDFMTAHTIIHIGTVDDKGEPNVVPTGYYFDKESNTLLYVVRL